MPGLLSMLPSTPLTAAVNFVAPRTEFSIHPKEYATSFDAARPPPTIETMIPIHDLRMRMSSPRGLASTRDQLDEFGYAVITHESKCDLGDGLDTVEGTNAYLEETIDLFKRELGASKVISWNSVIRKNTPDAGTETYEARQLRPEVDFTPAKQVKATARQAHVDQDKDYARIICSNAVGRDVFERYRRVQIVNLWRPLAGPVTNAPLAVCDFKSVDMEKDLIVFASAYGTGYGVHHNERQKWNFISRQLPTEALLLRCYDTEQGKDGQAMFCPHVACDVFGEEPYEGAIVPRSSIEVRLVVLHE